MRIWDITAPLDAATPRFPGDPPVAIRSLRSLAAGDPYNLSELRLGSHAGTHVDPPRHFLRRGLGIDRVDLARLNGPCTVIDVPRGRRTIDATLIGRVSSRVRRVLFRTANSARWARSERFFPDFVALDEEAAQALVARGVEAVGVDGLSVERDMTGTFPVHHRLLRAGTLIIEGLRLAGVRPGSYELRCLPLRIRSGDGGPARAILLRE